MVSSAIAFIAEESRLLSRAMSLLCEEISKFNLLLMVAFWISSFWDELARGHEQEMYVLPIACTLV
jgi:hypothetical protein